MYKYTICFIKQGEQILLLNREFPVWMGAWNGVGGKLEAGESPLDSVLREIHEETGILLNKAESKGVVTWTVDGFPRGGMYLFAAELPDGYAYDTPRKTAEGILDWKPISWILHPDNVGLATNIPHFLPIMLNDCASYDHQCTFENGRLTGFNAVPFTASALNSRK